jgi:copper homeostasis protein (lipoprotein)
MMHPDASHHADAARLAPRLVLCAARAIPFLALAFLGGCGAEDPPGEGDPAVDPTVEAPRPGGDPVAPAPLFPLPDGPAAWRGELPCADCPAIATTLLLEPDGRFRIEEAYLGIRDDRAARGDTVFASRGRWILEAEGRRIRLVGGDEAPRFFRAAEGGGLRALDREGAEIDSELPYDLAPLPALPEPGGALREEGLFSYWADAPLFVACTSGIQTPVAQEGAYLELERAYLAQGGAGGPDGATFRVWIDGEAVLRPSMEGRGVETVIVVEAWSEVRGGGESCAAEALPGALAGGTWNLVALEGAPVPEGLPEVPTLEIDPGESRLAGTGACNVFSGRAVRRGSELAPQEGLAASRRYCEGAMDVEARYLGVLAAGGYLRLDGSELSLFRGPLEVARFERE